MNVLIQCYTSENSLAVLPSVKYTVMIWPRNSTRRYVSQTAKTRCSNKNMYMNINSISHSSPNMETTQILINLWINITLYLHTLVYYLAMERNEVSTHACILYINFKHMLCEKKNVQKRLIYRDRAQVRGCYGQRKGGNGKWLLAGMRFFLDDTNLLELGSGMIHKILWIYLRTTEMYTSGDSHGQRSLVGYSP